MQGLVDYANEYGVGAGISLQVSGMIVADEIISAESYFDEFAAEFRGGFKTSPENGQAFFDLITSCKQYLKQPEGQKKVPPNYIYLRDVQIYTVRNHRSATKVTLWRGRLSEVGGFHLGTIAAE